MRSPWEMGREWEPDSRFCAEWGKWIFWRNDRWEIDRTKHHLTRTRTWMRTKEGRSLVATRIAMRKQAGNVARRQEDYAGRQTGGDQRRAGLHVRPVGRRPDAASAGRRRSTCAPARRVPPRRPGLPAEARGLRPRHLPARLCRCGSGSYKRSLRATATCRNICSAWPAIG